MNIKELQPSYSSIYVVMVYDMVFSLDIILSQGHFNAMNKVNKPKFHEYGRQLGSYCINKETVGTVKVNLLKTYFDKAKVEFDGTTVIDETKLLLH